MRYDTFTLQVLPRPDGSVAVAARSSAGHATGHLPGDLARSLPRELRLMDEGGGPATRRDFVLAEAGGAGRSSVEERLGATLYRALFTPDVEVLWERALARVEAGAGQRGLYLELSFPAADDSVRDLADLPWELLWEPRRRRFLGLLRSVAIVRSLETSQALRSPDLEPPVALLLASAAPTGSIRLDLEAERERILTTWAGAAAGGGAPPRLTIELLESAQPDTLRERLLDGGHQLLHFMGHGRHIGGETALVLEDPHGDSAALSGQDLAESLAGLECLRLVVLNACHGGRIPALPSTSPYAGLAAALLAVGIPSVVAMYGAVEDRAAVEFAHAFYRRLAARDPVEAAVSEARLALRRGDPPSADWYRPVLYQRRPVPPHPGVTVDPGVGEEKRPALARGVRFEPPPPPGEWVPRPRELGELRRLVLGADGASPVALVAALRGAGGYGKTTLAQAVCRDPEVLAAFDGVLWVTLGENPPDRVDLVEDLVHHLAGTRPAYVSLDAAAGHLATVLADRRLLIVLDDVWSPVHLRPFLRGGPRCVRLVTTRDRTVLPRGSRCVDVDRMSDDQAVALLSQGLAVDSNPAAFERLAAQLGRWPLLLGLVNGVLWDRVVHLGQPLHQALIAVHRQLEDRGVTAFDLRDPEDRHRAVATTVEVSLDRLGEVDLEHYQELAVFPEDCRIPLGVVEVLWGDATGSATEGRCLRLHQMSLLAKVDLESYEIQLHDVIRSYLVERAGERMAELHRRLLDRWDERLGGAWSAGRAWPWRALPPAEPYLWERLCFHLEGAGDLGALRETLLDLDFLAHRIHRGQTRSADHDLAAAVRRLPGDAPLATLHRVVSTFQQMFLLCSRLRDSRANLLLRTLGRPELAEVARAGSFAGTIRARPRLPLPDTPPASLLRTLPGHDLEVDACAFSADARRLVSTSEDGTLRAWSTETGETLMICELGAPGVACDVSRDGGTVAGATANTVEVWHVDSRVRLLRREYPGDEVRGCSLSGDGRRLCLGTAAGKVAAVRLTTGATDWEGDFGEVIRGGCRFDERGRTLILATTEKLLHLDGADGSLLRTIDPGDSERLSNCDLSDDGELAAVSAANRTTTIWDLESGRNLSRLEHGGSSPSSHCRFLPGSEQILLPCPEVEREGIGLWNWRRGEFLNALPGSSFVTACAAARSRVATADHLFQLRVWDRGALDATGSAPPRPGIYRSCGIRPEFSELVLVEDDGPEQWLRGRRIDDGELRWELSLGRRSLLRTLVAGRDLVITASLDRGVEAWDLAGGSLLGTLETAGRATRPAVDNSTGFIAGAIDGRLRLWTVPDLRPALDLPTGLDSATSCAVSPDDRWAAVTGDAPEVLLFDLSDPASQPEKLAGHQGRVGCCAFTPDGSRLVSGSEDETLRVWNLHRRDGDVASQTLRVHPGSTVWRMAFHGGHMLSVEKGFFADSIRLWDLDRLDCRLTLWHNNEPEDCAWLPGGTGVVVAGLSGLVVLDFEGLDDD